MSFMSKCLGDNFYKEKYKINNTLYCLHLEVTKYFNYEVLNILRNLSLYWFKNIHK